MKTLKKTKTEEEKKKRIAKILLKRTLFALFIAIISFVFSKNLKYSAIAFIAAFLLIIIYSLIKKMLDKAARIKKMEDVFPDFIELMASNLRAGMTIDKALLMGSRKEFSPLDEEILSLGKEVITGKEISKALSNMADRINSEKITKTIAMINSGIKSGGNLAILLEQTAINMRERNFVEKKAASNVLMYMIFIFFAVAIGAPLLFALSTVLLEILTGILGNMPSIEAANIPNIPFALTSIKISITFIMYFAIVFLIAIDILASLLLGLVSRGEEKAGLKFTLPLMLLSVTVFFIMRTILLSYFSGIA